MNKKVEDFSLDPKNSGAFSKPSKKISSIGRFYHFFKYIFFCEHVFGCLVIILFAYEI